MILILAGLLVSAAGCGTKTHRLATEQMLLSDAVDRAIDTIDFSPLAGQDVFLDTMYLQSARGQNLVNSEYVISSLRHQLAAARCYLKENRNEADIIVEPRIGTLGTDGHEVVYGIPPSGANRGLGGVIAGAPGASLALIPEISFGKNHAQSAMAKLIVYAYERESSEAVWQSGIARAESTSRDLWIFGAGPFQSGSIHRGVRFAGNRFDTPALKPLQQPEKAPVDFEYANEFSKEFPQYFEPIPAPPRPDHRSDVKQANLEEDD